MPGLVNFKNSGLILIFHSRPRGCECVNFEPKTKKWKRKTKQKQSFSKTNAKNDAFSKTKINFSFLFLNEGNKTMLLLFSKNKTMISFPNEKQTNQMLSFSFTTKSKKYTFKLQRKNAFSFRNEMQKQQN